jgi:hypothetical protein
LKRLDFSLATDLLLYQGFVFSQGRLLACAFSPPRRVCILERPALFLSFTPYDRPSLRELNSLKLKHVAKARNVLADFVGSYVPIESGSVAHLARSGHERRHIETSRRQH